MAAHLEALDGLDRKLTVTVPSEQVKTAWAGQLNKIKGQAKVEVYPGQSTEEQVRSAIAEVHDIAAAP